MYGPNFYGGNGIVGAQVSGLALNIEGARKTMSSEGFGSTGIMLLVSVSFTRLSHGFHYSCRITKMVRLILMLLPLSHSLCTPKCG